MLPLSEEAYWEMMEERTAPPFGGYGNAMAQEAAWYHSQGKACPFDCAACDYMGDPDDYEPVDVAAVAAVGQAPGDPWNTDPEPPF